MALVDEHHFPDRGALAQSLAEDAGRHLQSAIDAKGSAVLAVSGGSTPRQMFARLSNAQIDWKAVTIILVDERDVPPDHPRSNARLVREHLMQGPAEAAAFTPLRPDDALDHLEARLQALHLPPDVCFLGMGTDGHTASWFPGGDNLDAATRLVGERIVIDMQAPGAEERRFTLTRNAIAMTPFLALHIEGAEKLRTLEQAQQEGPEAEMPIRTLLNCDEARMQLYWAP